MQTEWAQPARQNTKTYQHIYGNMPCGGGWHVRLVSFVDLSVNFKWSGFAKGYAVYALWMFAQLFLRKRNQRTQEQNDKRRDQTHSYSAKVVPD